MSCFNTVYLNTDIKEIYLDELGEEDLINVEYFDSFIPGDRPWTMSSLKKAMDEAKKTNDKPRLRFLIVKLTEVLDCGDEEEIEDKEDDAEEIAA